MDYAFLMRMLHRMAYWDEQLHPLTVVQAVLVAILGNCDAWHVLHNEIRTSILAGAGIKHPRDIRMIHQCQRLAFAFKPRHNLTRVHTQLDHFERHLALDGLALLGQIDRSHAALTDQPQDSIGSKAIVFEAGLSPDGAWRGNVAVGADSHLALQAARHEARRAQARRTPGIQLGSAMRTSVHGTLLGNHPSEVTPRRVLFRGQNVRQVTD